MASIGKYGGRWRAEVNRRGIRRAKSFRTRQEAKDWAARVELDLAGGAALAARTTLGDMLDRYARERSPGKRGHQWEVGRIEKFRRDPIGSISLRDLAPHHLADWRDRRLREVAPGTVRREMVLLNAALNVARKEWNLLEKNPLRDVRKPQEPPRRTRLPSDEEIERLVFVAGTDLETAQSRAVHAFRFAIETGMRAGEIIGLTWRYIDLERRVATLPRTKNGDAREVPLSSEAIRLLEALPRRDPVFGLNSPQLDALFRKVRQRAGVEGLTFHDSRHAAITRLSRKLDVMALARMVGHRDIQMLMRYYDETAADIARRLD